MVVTPHTQRERGKVIGGGVHIYMCVCVCVCVCVCAVCIYVCGQKKLNCTLAIDSPFQTFVVGFLIEVIN